MGTPLTDGLILVHNALVGAGLRDRVKIGASGKVATGTDIVIQSQRCHTNRIAPTETRSYAELVERLRPRQLLAEPPMGWVDDWERADPDRF